MTVDRSRLPQPGPVRPFVFPAIDKSTLPNGLRVWTVRHPQIPVVTLLLLVRCGAADDPQGQHGLAALTADMLDEGSGDRSAIEMHEAMARIGQVDEARAVLERARPVSPLGLIAEDIDPKTKRMWGNFPQAYSHVGLIHAAFAASPTWAEVL